MLQHLETVDLCMLPTMGFLPGRLRAEPPASLLLTAVDFSIDIPLFPLMGFPALALPCGCSATGLLTGFQLAGKPFDEATVCQVVYAYE
jgi:aspartyl-tRNA(Asn)/glutamyl-tRNA(Gln) amidotransferase subunit A